MYYFVKLIHTTDDFKKYLNEWHSFTSFDKCEREAMYKYMVHAILNTRANVPEYQIARYKKELRAAKRNAKLRLSNLKIAELAQVMRNQSKWIKH